MTFFRTPVYLDTEVLVPLANYHDIDVTTDVAITVRDLGTRSKGGAAGLSLPVPGGPKFELHSDSGSESEVTQARTVKAHPTNALNRLVNALQGAGDLKEGLSGEVFKRQLVEVERDWTISPATDIGGLLSRMIGLIASNPALMQGDDVPDEVTASLLTQESSHGQVVLESEDGDDDAPRAIVLLDGGNILAGHSLQDLEGDRAVFGQVDAFVDSGNTFSLEKFFLSGFSRAMRRSIDVTEMLGSLSGLMGRKVDASVIEVPGPLVVVRAIAVY
ncbi:hypothetical protein [Serinicoccus sp. CUA-874]|uniref:DUF6414 family protein n=1 Tax=Serinicoccus sp. CUA-874 TaxID=1517939 RepID=UPI000969346F|nr:hypothetical protein [Serinicoccus sp. CUA-874]OLT31938.1 hypothetical protein BJF82_15260 [Kytococcus sp. CUA-901]